MIPVRWQLFDRGATVGRPAVGWSAGEWWWVAGMCVGAVLAVWAGEVHGLAQAGFWWPETAAVVEPPALVTNLAQLRGLDRATAKLGVPVRIEGVVTYREDQWPALFLQEGENAAFVHRAGDLPRVDPGERVEIEGRCVEGYAPAIRASAIRKLGTAELPPPIRTTLEGMGTGRYDGLRVTVVATVRWMHRTHRRLFLQVGDASGRYEVHIPEYEERLPVELLGAEVELTGITGTKLDAQGNMYGAGMSLPRLEDVRVLARSPADPWDRSIQAINTLMYFHPSTSFGQRTKVAGVVTLNTPSGKLYVEDGAGGCEVRLPAFQERPDPNGDYLAPPRPADLQVGDRVEVLGYPEVGPYTPVVADAVVRRVGTGEVAVLKPVDSIGVLSRPLDARRVRLRGRVVASEMQEGKPGVRQRLTIESGPVVFLAEFEGAEPVWAPVNSRVDLTGICAFEADAQRRPTAFRLLVPSDGDVRVLAGPPLITTGGLLKVVTPLAVVILGWVWLLRGSVAKRTAQLTASEERTRLIVETALDGVITMDATGAIRGWNAQAERIFGWSAAEVMGRSLGETIVPPAHREAHARGLAHFLRTGEGPVLQRRIEVGACHRSGREFPVELAITPLRVGDSWLFSAFVRDITERNRAVALLRESEERFSKAFQSSPAAIVVTRLEDGVFVAANEAFLKVSGFAESEVLGRAAADLDIYSVPDQREEYVALLRAHGSVRDREHSLRTKDGRIRTMLLSGELLELDGRPHVLTVGLDITDRKRTEAELVRSIAREKELNELKSSFVSMVSHEFRTPLGVIQSASDVLDRYLDRLPAEKRRKHLDMIFRSTRNLAQLVEGVLLLGKVEDGHMQFAPVPIDLRVVCTQLVEEVLSATDRACPIVFVAGEGDHGGAIGDVDLLRHILTNLLSNAVKYSEPGSPVTLAVARRDTDALFTVTDRGIGIPEEDHQNLFKSFSRGRNVGQRPGTGLGLLIVKRCAELHGGSVGIASRVGEGTAVTVTLPMFAPRIRPADRLTIPHTRPETATS